MFFHHKEYLTEEKRFKLKLEFLCVTIDGIKIIPAKFHRSFKLKNIHFTRYEWIFIKRKVLNYVFA